MEITAHDRQGYRSIRKYMLEIPGEDPFETESPQPEGAFAGCVIADDSCGVYTLRPEEAPRYVPTYGSSVALSPDGDLVAEVGSGSLVLTAVESGI